MPTDPFVAYHVHRGEIVAEYRIVMVQPFLPESALPSDPRTMCDVCEERAAWFDDGFKYCEKHMPEFAAEGETYDLA